MLTNKQKHILQKVFISAMEHDWNDWEDLCDCTAEDLQELYDQIYNEEYPDV